MTTLRLAVITLFALPAVASLSAAQEPSWKQWRGPTRDGVVAGTAWPDRLNEKTLEKRWRVPLGPSYSGPIVSGDLVFTTDTQNKESERVLALDRATGKERWQAKWKGAMTVPFFAAANGSWIRSTPALDGDRLFVAGMRDVLVCLDAKSGDEIWRVDFVKEFQTPLPDFGCVCSPLVDGGAVYLQAGASVAKVDAATGRVLWRTLKDKGGTYGSAFSSPVIATIAGKRQLVAQGREKLAGVDLETGDVLWSRPVPAFRGMNILTPLVLGDSVFTSTYSNKSWFFHVAHDPTNDKEPWISTEKWASPTAGYMSSPVVIDGHAYLHLQNQRFACIDLKTGERLWMSDRFGRYWSVVAQKKRILALDERGKLLLIQADPKKFDLIDELTVSDAETWAHLAVVGDEIYIRELNGLSAYRWKSAK